MDEIQRLLSEFSNMKVALEEARLDLNKKILELEEVKKSIEEEVKLKTRELSEEKARLLASINSLPLGFIITGPKFEIILKNDALEKILGISGSELTMENVAKYLSIRLESFLPELADRSKGMVIKNIKTDRKFLRMFLAPVNLSISSKDAIGYVFMLEDVTEQEMLERARSEFFAIASHELRTPLTVIRGNMVIIREFFADKIGDENILKMINSSYDSSVRLIQLVNDFLDVSSLELNKISFKKEKIDIISVIEEVKKDLSEMAKAKELEIKVSGEPFEFMVLADGERTKQVLTNLIGNSINYTNKGGITIDLHNKDNMVEIEISDTGVGIPVENHSLLFRKFQQAGSDIYARDVMRGTGLGLYISKLLVEGMGGKIDLIKSEIGKGSVFRFTLPVAS